MSEVVSVIGASERWYGNLPELLKNSVRPSDKALYCQVLYINKIWHF